MKIPIPIKNVLNQSWIYPAFLFFIGFISYIISYPPSGFYWDDWQAVFLYQNYDVNLLRDYFFYDRPFSSWTYEVVFPFLPMKPIVWQFFTMLVRVLGIWLIISAFEKIWEDRKELLRWAGALLLVFPSFTMQSISVAFNQHFITLFFFCFSIYLMVIGVISTKKWRWLFLILANISTIIHIFTMEYFVGLEVIRPIILFFALRKRYPHLTIKRNYLLTAQYYTSFFIILIGFIFWRIQIYPTLINDPITGKDPNTPVYLDLILKDPIKHTIKLANLIIQDSTYLLTQGLLRAIEPTSIRLDAAFYVFSVIVGLIISWFFSFFISSNQTISRIRDYKTPNKIFLLIGICALFFGGLAVWITGRQLLEGKWSDRFSLAPMLGVVLLIMVFIDWLISAKIRKNIILILALGFSIAFQMRTTHSYALDWQNQLEFYWQLYWRIPAVKPGTAFFSANLPSNYSSDYSVGFSLNTLFSNDKNGGELNHWYFDPGGRGFFFNKLEPENDIYYTFRNLSFSGSTSNAIAYMFKPASGCLLLLDKAYEGNPNMDLNHYGLIILNNPDQIDFSVKPKLPNSDIFGKEPAPDWCYYFQKADIERQNSNWDKVLEMMNEAHQLGLQPKSGVERMPELEAVFYLNDWESFVQISSDVYQMSDYLDRFLCTQWNRLETESQMTIPENIRIDLNNIVNCSEPFKQ